MTPDPWKRPSAVDDAADVMSDYNRYEQQLELQLNKTVDATQKQIDEWQDKELNWWADRQLSAVAIASIIQLSALAVMASVMLITNLVLKGG